MNGDERYKSTWIPGLGWKIGHKLWLGIYQKWCESNIFGHVYIYIYIHGLFIYSCQYVCIVFGHLYLSIYIYNYILYVLLYYIISYHIISYDIIFYIVLLYTYIFMMLRFVHVFFCICCVSSTTTKNFRSDGWNARWARSGLVAPWAPSWWKNRWTK